MRELLKKTIENERQMMMIKLSEAKGREFQSIVQLASVGCEMNMGVADWLAWSGY